MSDGLAEVKIRYDGKDADTHRIQLDALGQSLQGIAKILAVSGHFLITGQHVKKLRTADVRVLVKEGRQNCYSLEAVLEFTKQHQILSGSFGVTLAAIIPWFVARLSNNRAEMKALKDSLDKAIHELANQNSVLVPRMLDTIDKMADSLRSSFRQAVTPIGNSCSTLRIGEKALIDEPTAEAIRALEVDQVTEELEWNLRITELDLESASAKVRLFDVDGDRRYRAKITDPALLTAENAYIRAFASQLPLKMTGKAVLKDGEIRLLYISNTA